MFPPSSVVDVGRDLFGQAYQRMCELSWRSGVCAFLMTPNTHKAQLLHFLASCINAVRLQEHSEQSLMVSVTGTGGRGARGRHKALV